MTNLMPTPSGKIDYGTAEPIIEAIAASKAHQFRQKLGWFDEEDIKQEVRLKCHKILDRYDPTKSDLYIFLARCADNRIRDIRRSIRYKHNKPCIRCEHWDSDAAAAGKHDCRAFSNKLECDKFSKHERYVQVKLSVSQPVNIDEDRVYDSHFGRHVLQADLVDFVNTHIPTELKPLFITFMDANFDLKALKPKERTVLAEVLVDILEIHQEQIDD